MRARKETVVMFMHVPSSVKAKAKKIAELRGYNNLTATVTALVNKEYDTLVTERKN